MITKELEILIDELTALPSETEWVEFKKSNYPMVSRIIKDSIDSGLIKEYDNARMYIPFWAG